MKNLFEAGKLLLLDMASMFFFLVLFLLTHNVTLSVSCCSPNFKN
jgi:intracellular septation protein